ncbi:uncharacterized protein LOC133718623 [Rosa rugosa]|uniref:uncharacterized protein LOC133718623 n=1 Tax=Rosa rugosa TaxID=74645 RepID=UPI002B417A64|nr:uncharacterized protein LOC133718623 [Rosa rugosa]
MVEIDVDWVFRLNQLYYRPIVSSSFFYISVSFLSFIFCLCLLDLKQRFSSIRSLREKEQQKKATGTPSIKIENFEEMEESVGESTPQAEFCFHRYQNCYSKGYYDYQICLISLKSAALDDF